MNIIQTGFSLIEVTTKMTGSKYPYGKAEIRSSETAEKHGAISAILPDGITSKVWNLASYDADRYDRGCLISLHHAVQQAHYLKPKMSKIIITTDFNRAPKNAQAAGEWVNGISKYIDEEVDDAYQALREIINQSKLAIDILRVNQNDNGKARELAATQNRSPLAERRYYSINFDVTFFTDARSYQPCLEDEHQDAHISMSQMIARVN